MKRNPGPYHGQFARCGKCKRMLGEGSFHPKMFKMRNFVCNTCQCDVRQAEYVEANGIIVKPEKKMRACLRCEKQFKTTVNVRVCSPCRKVVNR
jgi:hypothetical protein